MTSVWFGVLTACFILLVAFVPRKAAVAVDHPTPFTSDDELKKVAYTILVTKCNGCHRKKNPLMIFNEKNMTKRAPRIYKAVFVEKRMPKGPEIRLTDEEATTLKQWLFTQKTM